MGSRDSKKAKGSDSPWGGDGDDLWGSSAAAVPSEPSTGPPPPRTDRAPFQKISLLESLEPVLLFMCEQHRVAREGGELVFDVVQSACNKLLDVIYSRTPQDAVLQQQFKSINDPLRWFIDFWFGSSGEFPPALQKSWNQNRLGEYSKKAEEGSLAGEDAFFDKLEETMMADVQDESANERLAFYYIAIGLGFTGRFFKPIDEHQQNLRDYMTRLYPRVRRYIDPNPASLVTPEAYGFTDKRDFVTPVRDRPLILLAAFLCLLATMFIGYIYLYGEQKLELESAIKEIQQTEAAQSGPN